MTLRSRRKPPTTALNLTATRTESAAWFYSATGLIFVAFSLALVLPAAAETKAIDKAKSTKNTPSASTQSSTLTIKDASAQPNKAKPAPGITLSPLSAAKETQIRVVSFGADAKKWTPTRPSDSASLHFAKNTKTKSGWIRSRGSNVQLSDTSTHLNWGPRDGAKSPDRKAVAKGKGVLPTGKASSNKTELPRRVGDMFQTPLVLSPKNGERQFGDTLTPPPTPLLSSIPRHQAGKGRAAKNLQAKNLQSASDVDAAARLKKAVASSTRAAKQPIHVPTPQVEPQKPVKLIEPVPHRVAEKANVKAKAMLATTSNGPQLVAKGATSTAKEATKPSSNEPVAKFHGNHIKQLAQSPATKPGEQVKPAQHLVGPKTTQSKSRFGGKFSSIPLEKQEQLRLPIANLRDGKSWQPKQTNAPFSAPLPSQAASDPNSRETRVAERFRFKDLTPLTKPVQSMRPNDDFFDLPPDTSGSPGSSDTDSAFSFDDISAPSNDASSSTATDDLPKLTPSQLKPLPDAPSSSRATPDAVIDLDQEFADPLVEPNSDLPDLSRPSTQPFDSVPSPSDRSSSLDQSKSGKLEDVEALRKQIEEQLSELEDLPDVEGDDNDLDLDNIEDDSSPLFSSEKPAENAEPTGELSATNGRDCQANAESCSKDMTYINRRQRTSEISLNISPLLSPAEVDMAKAEQTRADKMAKVPMRVWRDRRGNVIADGQLDDFRDDLVVIRTVNGSYRTIPQHKLCDADRCFVATWWEIPLECNFENERYDMRDFRLTTFTWAAAGTCHKPLYFEQVGVERYGHSSGPIVQPIVSGVHFFGDIFMLPYHMGIHPPNECMYSLGYYRPGNCAPWLVPGFPISDHSIKWQGVALGAAITLLP